MPNVKVKKSVLSFCGDLLSSCVGLQSKRPSEGSHKSAVTY